MTIIAAASWNGSTYIGCDQAGTDGWGTQQVHGTKLHRARFGWLGYTGSYRTLQVIHRQLRTVEEIRDEEDMEAVVATIEAALEDAGWSKSRSGGLPTCDDLHLLLATWAGDLWVIQSDLAYLQAPEFAAIGSGWQVALGSLHTSRGVEVAPSLAVERALGAACDLISTCAAPAAAQRVHREDRP